MKSWVRWLITWRRGDIAAFRGMTPQQRQIARVYAVPPRLLGRFENAARSGQVARMQAAHRSMGISVAKAAENAAKNFGAFTKAVRRDVD